MEEIQTENGERREKDGFDEIIAKYSDSDEFVYKLHDGKRVVMTLQEALRICGPDMRRAAQTPEGRTQVEAMFQAMHVGAQKLKEQHPDVYEEYRAAGQEFMADR